MEYSLELSVDDRISILILGDSTHYIHEIYYYLFLVTRCIALPTPSPVFMGLESAGVQALRGTLRGQFVLSYAAGLHMTGFLKTKDLVRVDHAAPSSGSTHAFCGWGGRGCVIPSHW